MLGCGDAGNYRISDQPDIKEQVTLVIAEIQVRKQLVDLTGDGRRRRKCDFLSVHADARATAIG